jgi:hypothetical protein
VKSILSSLSWLTLRLKRNFSVRTVYKAEKQARPKNTLNKLLMLIKIL